MSGREIFITEENSWKFHPGDGETPADWMAEEFDDSKWDEGFSPFAYGRYRANTFVNAKERPRPMTTYYRTNFQVDDPEAFEWLDGRFRVDDGVVIWLNGKILTLWNIDDKPSYSRDDKAAGLVRQYASWRGLRLPRKPSTYLKKGKNTIAVEVHQENAESSDMVFQMVFAGAEKGLQEEEVFSRGSEWKFYDRKAAPSDDWNTLEFDDSAWGSGRGILGYGDDDLTTTLSSRDEGVQPVTAWFRKTFEVDEGIQADAVNFEVIVDDGAIFYLNGKEVKRHKMPGGFVDPQTFSSESTYGYYERFDTKFRVGGGFLQPGKNVLAVEVHQDDPNSSDLALDVAMGIEYFKDGGARLAKVKSDSKEVNISDTSKLKESKADDWLLTSQELIKKALISHEKGKLTPAVQAYYASKWAAEFSKYGNALDSEMMEYLLQPAQSAVSQEFFDLYSNEDNHQEVYQIINHLFRSETESFKEYPKLAFAIGIVYDQKPPSGWPHHQVPGHVLPRQLPAPQDAMKFWVETEKGGDSLHPLDELSLEELKYVVDTPAPFSELKEAHDVRARLGSFDNLYQGINYVHERLENNAWNWPHESYNLTEIKERGGICVDQAYYTVQVAKAHGVPSMVVSGSGNNGNHAWVGFLDNRGRWDFTVGRYEESKFVTGATFDPQTWTQPTDHQIAMMSERFRTNSKFRISRIHTVFAEEYLQRDKVELAIATAEKAIESEDRNYSAWEVLLAAKAKTNVPAKELDEIYEKGAQAFSRYADLEAGFLRRLASSYEKQGLIEEAEKLRARIISRNRRERPDLALEEAKIELDRAMDDLDQEEQLSLYKRQIGRLREAGLIAYYALTNPFLEHMVSEERKDLAEDALKYTRRRMDVEEASQLDQALTRWEDRIGG